MNEAHCLDFIEPLEQSFADAVHTIHHPAVARENDREFKIAIEHQARVPHHFAAGQLLARCARPIRLVEFFDRGQRNTLPDQRTGKLDEPPHIPRAQSLRRIPEMILSPQILIPVSR